MVKFECSKKDDALISIAAKRATNHELGTYNLLDIVMDIKASHCNGNPLDLPKLLAANDTNFAHDIFGIKKNLCRKTGKLQNCFSPRSSAKDT